jgi:FixJ family two-component response regulator
LESVRTGGSMAGTLPKVFVVSDDRDCRDSLVSLLKAFHFAVAAFDAPDEFLKQCQKEWTGCVLLELTRTAGGEVELLEELQRRGMGMPVVVIAHAVQIPTVVQVMQLGALHLTETPYDINALHDWIERGLAMDARRHGQEELQITAQRQLKLLTADEQKVLGGILAGWHNKVIASRLDIGVRTVQARRAGIMRKLDCQSVAKLVWKVLLARQHDEDSWEWCEAELDFTEKTAGAMATSGKEVGKVS